MGLTNSSTIGATTTTDKISTKSSETVPSSAKKTNNKEIPKPLNTIARKTPETAPHAKAIFNTSQGSLSFSSEFLIDLR